MRFEIKWIKIKEISKKKVFLIELNYFTHNIVFPFEWDKVWRDGCSRDGLHRVAVLREVQWRWWQRQRIWIDGRCWFGTFWYWRNWKYIRRQWGGCVSGRIFCLFGVMCISFWHSPALFKGRVFLVHIVILCRPYFVRDISKVTNTIIRV